MGCWRELALARSGRSARAQRVQERAGWLRALGGGSLMRTPSPNGPILFWNLRSRWPGLEMQGHSNFLPVLQCLHCFTDDSRAQSEAELKQRAVIPPCNIESPITRPASESRQKGLTSGNAHSLKFRLGPAITSVANVG